MSGGWPRIKRLEKQMLDHAKNGFEKAAQVRDQLAKLRTQVFGGRSRGDPPAAVHTRKRSIGDHPEPRRIAALL